MVTTIASIGGISGQKHIGPFVDGNNNVYVILLDTVGNTVEAWKASDPTSTWTEQDTAGRPTEVTSISGAWAWQEGDTLHVVYGDGATVRVWEFFTSDHATTPDEWSASGTTITLDSNASAASPFLVARSDGDLVCLHGNTEKIHGTTYTRAVYSMDQADSWGTQLTAVSPADSNSYSPRCIAIGENDDIYFGYIDGSNFQLLTFKRLSSGNALSAAQATAYAPALYSESPLGHWDQNASGKTYFAAENGTTMVSFHIRYNGTSWDTNGASNTISTNINDNYSLALDTATQKLYAAWEGTSLDLYRSDLDISTTGNSWATETEVVDAVTVSAVSPRVIDHGGGKVLALVFEDGATTKYEEVSLGGGTTTLVAAAGSYSHTGTAAALKEAAKITAASGAYSHTGTAADLRIGVTLTAESGSYTQAGTAAALTEGATVAADAGSYTHTGTAAAISESTAITAEAGVYSHSGTAAQLTEQATILAAAGAYLVTGTDATLQTQEAFTLTADAGAYAHTGTDATLSQADTLTADPGSYATTGTAATLTAAETVTAESGAYSHTGTAANLRAGQQITAEPGTYTIAGTAAALTEGATLTVDAGAYTISGSDATLVLISGGTLVADAGSYAVTGTAASMTAAELLNAAAGSYVITGTAATLTVVDATVLTAESGSYAHTGTAATLTEAATLPAETGTYAHTGTAAQIGQQESLTAESGAYALTGSTALLSQAVQLIVDAGAYNILGADAVLQFNGLIACDTYRGVEYVANRTTGWHAVRQGQQPLDFVAHRSAAWTGPRNNNYQADLISQAPC